MYPETQFLGLDTLGEKRSAFKRQYMSLRRLTSDHMSLQDFYRRFKMAAVIDFLVPTVAYSVVFAFATIFFTVELPPLFKARFNFNPEQNGLQYISPIIGFVSILVWEVMNFPSSGVTAYLFCAARSLVNSLEACCLISGCPAGPGDSATARSTRIPALALLHWVCSRNRRLTYFWA